MGDLVQRRSGGRVREGEWSCGAPTGIQIPRARSVPTGVIGPPIRFSRCRVPAANNGRVMLGSGMRDRPRSQISRRRALQVVSAGAIGAVVAGRPPGKAAVTRLLVSRASIDVRSFGATGNGTTSDTSAIQHAVDEATRQGAVVNFPPGRYLSGTVELRSHIKVVFAKGATLVASPDNNQFSPDVPNYGDTFDVLQTANASYALLTGAGLSDVTIEGPGGIDMNRPPKYGVTGSGPKGIGLRECVNIVIDNLTMAHAPNRNIELMGCEEVTVTRVQIVDGYVDGIDPDGCKNVHIADCWVDTYDDAIVIKSSFALGRRVDSSNITVERCHVRSSTNGLKIGTETEGNVKGVRFADCVVANRPSPGIPLVLAEHGGVAIESADGGHVSDVTVSNIVIQDVAAPLFVRLENRGTAQTVPTPGTLSNVAFKNVRATGATLTSSITGLPGHRVQNVTLSDVDLSSKDTVRVDPPLSSVKELPNQYPNAAMFATLSGPLPAAGLYARHVEGLKLSRVILRQPQGDARAGLVIDDGRSVDLESLQLTGRRDPVLWLNDVQAADVTFSRQSDMDRSNVRLTGGSDDIHFGSS